MAIVTDPQMLAFIERTEASYPADANLATAEENRRFYDAMCAVFSVPRPENIDVEDVEIDGVPVRKYHPKNLQHEARLLYTHGGGFVVGSLDSHDDVCAELASRTGAEVWASDYRLCPEHDYPAPLDDVEKVWRAMIADGRKGIVAGDSAGGNLSAALTHRMKRLNGPMPSGQLLIYPGFGAREAVASMDENAEAPLLRKVDIEAYAAIYGGEERRKGDDPEHMPLRAADFAGLPPAFVISADVDPLRDEAGLYVERLKDAGNPAEWRNEPEMVHGYLRARHMSDLAAASFDVIIDRAKAFLVAADADSSLAHSA